MNDLPFPARPIAGVALTALLAGAIGLAAVSCGVKVAPTPVMNGFEPRYEPEVRARLVAAGPVNPSAGPSAPLSAGPSTPLAPQVTAAPGVPVNPSTGTVGSPLNSPLITPTAAISPGGSAVNPLPTLAPSQPGTSQGLPGTPAPAR